MLLLVPLDGLEVLRLGAVCDVVRAQTVEALQALRSHGRRRATGGLLCRADTLRDTHTSTYSSVFKMLTLLILLWDIISLKIRFKILVRVLCLGLDDEISVTTS